MLYNNYTIALHRHTNNNPHLYISTSTSTVLVFLHSLIFLESQLVNQEAKEHLLAALVLVLVLVWIVV